MGWMNDTLAFVHRDPLYRHEQTHSVSLGLIYAFSENFVLPLSHDEVVHGKGSLWGKMPGYDEGKFANLRLLIGHLFAHPGKKLLFAGGEFGQRDEWRAGRSLDWHLAAQPAHAGLQRLVGDCNRLYRERAALHALDAAWEGFEWIAFDDRVNTVFAWVRYAAGRADHVIAAVNFSGRPIDGYRIGVPHAGRYHEILNTDAAIYGGANVGNLGEVQSEPVPMHGYPNSIAIVLPALAAVYFAP
jgi:1,4-alpha-glucan branching enzyme